VNKGDAGGEPGGVAIAEAEAEAEAALRRPRKRWRAPQLMRRESPLPPRPPRTPGRRRRRLTCSGAGADAADEEHAMAAATLERHADVIERSVPAGYADEGDEATYAERAAKLRAEAAAIRATIAAKLVCYVRAVVLWNDAVFWFVGSFVCSMSI
jgi:hypothetical protein